MLNIKPQFLEILKSTGNEVTYFYPQDKTVLPLLSYFELSNIEKASYNNQELYSEVVYQVDIWCKQPSECSSIAINVDQLLRDSGFTREFSTDMFEQETKIYRKSLRYRGVVDNKLKIYK
jgi:hypothetical protein